MEYEVRYFFSNNSFGKLKKTLLSKYKFIFSAYELTIMYDNPNPILTFYSPEIDGRLRFRSSQVIADGVFGKPPSNTPQSSCLLTWKRRLPDGKKDSIRKEEEIEYEIAAKNAKSAKQILEEILQCPRISSYERIRHNFDSQFASITLDQFPYGLMLEFEAKPKTTEKQLLDEVASCKLDPEESSKMSCDDQYFSLCKRDGIKPKSDILFNDPTMPKLHCDRKR